MQFRPYLLRYYQNIEFCNPCSFVQRTRMYYVQVEVSEQTVTSMRETIQNQVYFQEDCYSFLDGVLLRILYYGDEIANVSVFQFVYQLDCQKTDIRNLCAFGFEATILDEENFPTPKTFVSSCKPFDGTILSVDTSTIKRCQIPIQFFENIVGKNDLIYSYFKGTAQNQSIVIHDHDVSLTLQDAGKSSSIQAFNETTFGKVLGISCSTRKWAESVKFKCFKPQQKTTSKIDPSVHKIII